MSEVMKPENECPFDPKQYECHSVIAPVGSFSWALIQLKLRKLVARSVWSDKKMYLAIVPRVNDLTVEEGSAYAVDGVAVGTKYDYLTHIDLRNEHGNFVPWQPTQEDMMACDWNFFEDKVKAEPESDDMLVFDLKSEFGEKAGYYGYLSENKISDSNAAPIGTLTIIQNKIDIKNILIFHTVENPGYIHFSVSFDEVNSQKVKELFKKNLYVKVDNITYNLGTSPEWSSDITNSTSGVLYNNDPPNNPHKVDTEKLGRIIKQTGVTKRFYLNWSDA
ncbi:DUF2829 domain-containing protein [Photorhabdus bodei]|uniref:DUF2829 domain-containing protein n=1 Tax=Photorhabdus bodei TaxID=2029681 RepID=A0A329X0A6_9GAMM|nr:DUF2829 domain-containing protein [Photorhabdus bodei]NDK98261.1 DUF2829 domain-containing protein [Photorhabdus bodei]NDL02512.1 DUF2829 domain-containing protein [Photorhabdus bodei]NDL06586.1 DUF2829 domain-containing protein [Photorhabdus bodei]RAX10344.1 hypothetical protein CKY02_15400 [Photorhabdus bodei]